MTIAPVIEAGYESPPGGIVRYRGPDTFKHFEIELRVPWYRAPFIPTGRVELEMWTAGDESYVRWLFPYVTWKRRGRTFVGCTHEGPPVYRPEIPDGEAISHGGFWTVAVLP